MRQSIGRSDQQVCGGEGVEGKKQIKKRVTEKKVKKKKNEKCNKKSCSNKDQRAIRLPILKEGNWNFRAIAPEHNGTYIKIELMKNLGFDHEERFLPPFLFFTVCHSYCCSILAGGDKAAEGWSGRMSSERSSLSPSSKSVTTMFFPSCVTVIFTG